LDTLFWFSEWGLPFPPNENIKWTISAARSNLAQHFLLSAAARTLSLKTIFSEGDRGGLSAILQAALAGDGCQADLFRVWMHRDLQSGFAATLQVRRLLSPVQRHLGNDFRFAQAVFRRSSRRDLPIRKRFERAVGWRLSSSPAISTSSTRPDASKNHWSNRHYTASKPDWIEALFDFGGPPLSRGRCDSLWSSDSGWTYDQVHQIPDAEVENSAAMEDSCGTAAARPDGFTARERNDAAFDFRGNGRVAQHGEPSAHGLWPRRPQGALERKPIGGRKRENMSLDEERALLARFAKAAGAGEMLNIHDLKAAGHLQ
jgi:hypothetical protein